MKNHLIYFFIFSLTALFVFTNIIDKSRADAPEIKLSKTVASDLIPADLGARPDEDLIEERAITNNTLIADQRKRVDDPYILDKNDALISSEDYGDNSTFVFNNVGDAILKPLFTGVTSPSGDQGDTPQRNETIYYTVQNGDTVSMIARRFGLTVNTILWANNLSTFSLIRPGDLLTILPTSGILYTVKSGDTLSRIAANYGVDTQKILSVNNLNGGLKAGQKIILPGANKITTPVTIAKTAIKASVAAVTNLAKAPAVAAGTGKMAWPTEGYRITQYFSWRHNGVDIANKVGTPLYAAEAGVVEISQGGWNGGYGSTIVINHGGGYKTRYGHASKLFVKAGDKVEKGENIAAMGSTGNSTGSHLHFEVIINGTRYNPLNYIK